MAKLMKLLCFQIWIYTVFSDELWRNPEFMVVAKDPLCIHAIIDVSKELIQSIGPAKFDAYYREVITSVSKIFAWHNIKFFVDQQNFWSSKNDITIGGTVTETTVEYQKYVNSRNKPEVVNILLVNIDNTESNLGKGYIGGICTNNAYAVCQAGNRSGWEAMYTAQIIAHEVGHVLGLHHVDASNKTCYCPLGDYCIMSQKTYWWRQEYPPSFDSCSIKSVLSNVKWCLKDCSMKADDLNPPVCGNNIIEKGEQCDCGFSEACEVSNRLKCCDPKTCRFKSADQQCEAGVCCQDCKFKRGSVCKESSGECDLPVYCGGSSPNCPTAYKTDGIKCANGQAYCVSGICQTKDAYCKQLFPNSNTTYSEECYNFAAGYTARGCTGLNENMQNLFCGTGKGICGQVYCTAPSNDPFYQFSSGSMKCYTLLDTPEDKYFNKVPYGGVCGNSQVCYAYKCSPDSKIMQTCSSACKQYEQCNGFGRYCVPTDPKWFQVNQGDPYKQM